MKQFYSFFALILISMAVMGQTPSSFKYQAVLRDASGNVLVKKDIVIDFGILKNSATGTLVFLESHSTKTNEFGLVNLEIGSKNSAGFSVIDWSDGPYFAKITVDGNEMGTSQLLGVPYAFHAKTADNGFSGDYTDLKNKPDFNSWDQNSNDDFSGDYNDLINLPELPAINDATISSSALWSSNKVNNLLSTKANTNDVYSKADLQTSGQAIINYNNVDNKPANLDINKTDDVLLSGNQIIGGNKTFSGPTIFNNGINLNDKTIINVAGPVNATDAVNKAYVDELENRIDQLADLLVSSELVVKDIDGNYYNIVSIGDQIWMKENLRTTKYNDGTSILNVTDNGTWLALNTPAYSWYANDIIYRYPNGALYNWYAVNTGKICPSGWRVSSDDDWKALEMALGMSPDAANSNGWRGTDQGTQIKNTIGWDNEGNGTNLSGFSAIPAGLRDWDDGIFYWITTYSHWWTSTEGSSDTAWDRDVSYEQSEIFRFANNKKYGMSVRCVKD